MGLRGPKPQEMCIAGHDLSNPDNVRITRRVKGDKVYKERQCKVCARQRARDWWRKNSDTWTGS